MGYIAVKGGTEAIENACKLHAYERIKGKSKPLGIEQIKEQLYLLVDRVMGEGSLYAPDLAALAIKQSAGDVLEASFLLRAYRTTLSRVGYSIPQSTKDMQVIRRISAAFKDIPGGQILGPTSDYTLRLLDFKLFKDSIQKRRALIKEVFKDVMSGQSLPDSFPKVIEILRNEGLLTEANRSGFKGQDIFDITRQSLTFPASRSAAMQAMARGETGGLLLLAYSNMRGYGDIHPTIGELRVGYIPVKITHPFTGRPYHIGNIKVTEAEVIAKFIEKDGKVKFSLGCGICFGHNETKAISMAVLDRAMQTDEAKMVSEDQEFVLSHIDGVDSMGFCNHYKLPHYITFQSDLDRLRKAQIKSKTVSQKLGVRG
ncbi:MAG: carbon-phosphorus lyase complex subunit PhnI [Thermodesulfovibrionales bacterium]|nr:carbon-phosphorus lyase complex subunit PhnI [Thermodesulfovibrionales bacterium]